MAGEYLWVTAGGSPGEAVEVGGDGLVIGRDPGVDLPVDDPKVSRRHARFVRTPEGLAVEDLGSTNGTLLNDQRLTGLRPLRAGDRVAMGACVIEVRAHVAATEIGTPEPEPAPPAAPAPAPPVAAPAPPPPAQPAPPPLAGRASEPHGYPEPGRQAVPAASPAPPPPAHRAAPGWGEVPGGRSKEEGIRALKGDAHVRFRAYLATVVVLVLVALVVVLYLVTR